MKKIDFLLSRVEAETTTALNLQDGGETTRKETEEQWFEVHKIWVQIMEITRPNDELGQRARKEAVECAIKAGRRDEASATLCELLAFTNITPQQFEELILILKS
ncbi:MAG TPA: hypothetical protein VJB58_02050 [Candidatus Paceibacterota bacterium]